MKSTLALIPALLIGLAAGPASAAEARVKCRITGLFQPDRVDDLRRQGGTLRYVDGDASTEFKLVAVDYENVEAIFAYDPNARALKGARQEQVRERIDQVLRRTRGAPSRPSRRAPCRPIAGKRSGSASSASTARGVASAAYRALAKIDGVERATVDLKKGVVTAWVDPSKTDRAALVAALKKAYVNLLESSPDRAGK